MSYQVLARKWRPRSFVDMVGQGHVVQALSNALDQDRLHHAYLFAGTRGVGKTTLARILSKALNCEEGVSASPCGRCSACREIDEGRFVDLLEVDAASRTKVDQTRELLDNVPFAPVKGRFKVYLIDEVHMFSASSFNALLKTLEEPPPHVKFLLATTDPQKVPVTVLSRCLQFNLKRLVPAEIHAQLDRILQAEGIPFEEQALALLARAADGSMRDGLSLLDQAIAYGGGRVGADEVRTMLGAVGRDISLNLARALARRDGAGLLDEVARAHEFTPDFDGLLQDLLLLLHRIALYQQVPATLADDDPEREDLIALAEVMNVEDVQLYYQIALLGQQDLSLAPDARTGMEMVLLRMLAFRPADAGDAPGQGSGTTDAAVSVFSGVDSSNDLQGKAGALSVSAPSPSKQYVDHPATAALAAARLAVSSDKAPAGPRPAQQSSRPPVADLGGAKPLPPPAIPPWDEAISAGPKPHGSADAERMGRMAEASTADTFQPEAANAETTKVPRLDGPEDWHALVASLGLGGVASELARNCELSAWDGQRLVLTLDPASRRLQVEVAERRLCESLRAELGKGLTLEIRVSRPQGETPSQRRTREQAERQAAAEALIESDQVVQAMRSELGARIIPGTIAPADPPTPGDEGGQP